MSIIGEAPDFDLTSGELFLAKNTKAFIIERIPASELILATQNRESIFWRQVNIHFGVRTACSIAENAQSEQRRIALSAKVLWVQGAP
jgi:hypothetical protein